MTDDKKILKRPIITEKMEGLTSFQRQYAFEVDKRANKIEIKQAVEKRFDVKVSQVRTMNMGGKMKRLGRFLGQRSSWKKALVTLQEGYSIKYFENI